MQDITQLEQRISAAFARIDRGLERLANARAVDGVDAVDAVDVAAALDQELHSSLPDDLAQPSAQTGNAAIQVVDAAPDTALSQIAPLLRALELAKASTSEWAERYSALQAQMGEQTLAMANEIARLTAELAVLHAAPSVETTNTPDADRDLDDLTARLAAQEAELEILRAQRDQDTAEIGDIIAALTPLVKGAPHV